MRSSLRPIAAVGSLTLTLALAMLGIGCHARDSWPVEPFTPEAWKAQPWEQRYVMYRSLKESRLLDGATRERVIELLGEPNAKRKADNVAYLIRKGKMELFNWHEVEVLDIRLDESGKVRKYFIRGT